MLERLWQLVHKHTVRDLVAAIENKPLDCRELVPSMKEQDRCQRMALW